jgi:competence protein ComEC
VILEKGGNVHCTVLKVGHHGSNTSSSEEFLKAASPSYAVICVGANNNFGHPKAEVLERLKGLGAQVLRTDRQGEIKFCTDGTRMKVETYVK